MVGWEAGTWECGVGARICLRPTACGFSKDILEDVEACKDSGEVCLLMQDILERIYEFMTVGVLFTF